MGPLPGTFPEEDPAAKLPPLAKPRLLRTSETIGFQSFSEVCGSRTARVALKSFEASKIAEWAKASRAVSDMFLHRSLDVYILRADRCKHVFIFGDFRSFAALRGGFIRGTANPRCVWLTSFHARAAFRATWAPTGRPCISTALASTTRSRLL